MSRLTQQELLEPGPVRRLIVPVGCSSWWGVDPSSTRVAVAGVRAALAPAEGPWHRWSSVEPFIPLDGAARLEEIHTVTTRLVRDLVEREGPPGVVFVEQPGGSQRNFPLYYATGVICAAVYGGVRDVTQRLTRVEMVSPSWWKKRACGFGAIYKPKKGDRKEYGVLTWARENGYGGSSWDEADAFGIAEAARREIALDER